MATFVSYGSLHCFGGSGCPNMTEKRAEVDLAKMNLCALRSSGAMFIDQPGAKNLMLHIICRDHCRRRSFKTSRSSFLFGYLPPLNNAYMRL